MLDIEKLQVQQDVETRWNSSLAMMRRLLKIMPTIASVLFSTKQNHLLPNDRDTKMMEDLVNLLSPFETGTNMLSSEKEPTASPILPLIQVLEKYTNVKHNDSSVIRKAKEAMRKDIEKRYKKRGST